MRTVFLGTSGFAATVLARLAASDHRPALVVTPPDRPRGRGRKLGSPPAAETARELGIEMLQAASVNEPAASERVRAAKAEAGVVCAFGQLIKEPLLAELELLNVHPSLLPRWRGAAPIERALMAGEEATGVSVMRLTAGLDSGPVALTERVPIEPEDDFASLEARLAARGGELLVRALDLRAADKLELREQDESQATYAEKIQASDRRLDPERSAVELANRVRALTPHIGAYIELADGERLGVQRAEPAPGKRAPGVFAEADGRLELGCGEGVLRLLTVQPPGKRPMPADAYLRGHPAPTRAA